MLKDNRVSALTHEPTERTVVSYEELRSEYFSALTKQSVNKSFIIWQAHETQNVCGLTWQRKINRSEYGKILAGKNQPISELGVQDAVYGHILNYSINW